MSSKITMEDVMAANCRISNAEMLTSNHCAALARELNTILAAPVVERLEVLPCDVQVAPATLIRKGCKVETLLRCIELRKGRPPEFTMLKSSTLPELAELQAEVRRLEAEIDRLSDELETAGGKK